MCTKYKDIKNVQNHFLPKNKTPILNYRSTAFGFNIIDVFPCTCNLVKYSNRFKHIILIYNFI